MPLFDALTCRHRGVGYPPLAFCYLAKLLTCIRHSSISLPYIVFVIEQLSTAPVSVSLYSLIGTGVCRES